MDKSLTLTQSSFSFV